MAVLVAAPPAAGGEAKGGEAKGGEAKSGEAGAAAAAAREEEARTHAAELLVSVADLSAPGSPFHRAVTSGRTVPLI